MPPLEQKEISMIQAEVNRAVARATGETVRTIAQLGFGIADQDVVDHDPEPCDMEDKSLDRDALGNQRVALVP